MTTKHKIMASIWVPIVSSYILSFLYLYFTPNQPLENPLEIIFGLMHFFLDGVFFWVPLLFICLLVENIKMNEDIQDYPIVQIFILEAFICLVPLLLFLNFIPDSSGGSFRVTLITVLSIAARWGYLKLRKIC